MSYENGTIHYNLPQTVDEDKRDWFDTNEAFANIDSAIHTAEQTAEGNAEQIVIANAEITSLKDRMDTAESDIDNAEAGIDTLNEAVGTMNTRIARNLQDIFDMICTSQEDTAIVSKASGYNAGDYFIYNETLWVVTHAMTYGAQIVPDTNCQSCSLTDLIKTLQSYH